MTLASALHAVPTLLVLWAVVTALFVGLLTYRGQLTRYEDEQLFLADINPDGPRKQSEIVRRVNQVQPFVRIFAGVASLLAVSIVGIWVAEALQTLSLG